MNSGIRLEETGCVVCNGKPSSKVIARAIDFEYDTSSIEFSFVECTSCGHVYLNPRPTIASAPAMYPPTYYTFSADKPALPTIILEKIKQRVIVQRLKWVLSKIKKDATIMEVGCGDGSTLIAIKNAFPELNVAALDLFFTEEQKRRLQKHNIAVIQSTLETAHLEPNGYDLIFMNQLIEHLWDINDCMKKTHAILRTGGFLSVSTPNLDGHDRKWFSEKLWGGYHVPRHLNLFTRKSLKSFLKARGFSEVKFTHLSASLIHITTLHNYFKAKKHNLYKLCKYTNLPVLFIFTLLDSVMMRLGFSTSNQQIIVQKE